MIYLSHLPNTPKSQLPARESQRAWELLRFAAQELGYYDIAGIPDLKAAARRGEHGKPYLPGWGLHFSISHSHGLAACAVEGNPVGLDVERVRHFSEAVERRICSPGELKLVSAASNRDRALTRLWTCKEAYMKYTGLGFAQGITETEFEELGERPRMAGNVAVKFWSFPIIIGSEEFFVTECL